MHPMMGPRVVADPEKGSSGATSGIGSSICQRTESGLDDGACAHGAGFKCYIEFSLIEPPVAQFGRRGAERYDFCVGKGVAFELSLVPAATNDAVAQHNDGPYGNITCSACRFGLKQGFAHVLQVTLGHLVPHRHLFSTPIRSRT